eukprot:comp22042_c0_seq1/m.32017 comp22042_c0_seq1/g.32017  ORF comp22042_c0_seq1/g.32017 comp22042_c0_seq1/m.32017 type:complete len:381 (-) comp22042_c0_seq1:517-1659(-)
MAPNNDVKSIEELNKLFGGVVAKEEAAEGRLLIVPLSSKNYKANLADNGLDEYIRALELGSVEVQSHAARQLGRMALFEPLRQPLLDRGVVGLVAGVLKAAPKPVDKGLCENCSSFVSNMLLATYTHHPDTKAHAKKVSEYGADLLFILNECLMGAPDKSAVVAAVSYALHMISQCKETGHLMLKTGDKTVDNLYEFLLRNANGETEAQNTPVVKQAIESIHTLVTQALEGTSEADTSVVPGVSPAIARCMLETVARWHMEFHPWSWISKPTVAQFAPRMLQEYIQQQMLCTQVLTSWVARDWAAHGNQGDVKKDDTVFGIIVQLGRQICAMREGELPLTISDEGVRLAVAMVSPNRIAAEESAEYLEKEMGGKKVRGRK